MKLADVLSDDRRNNLKKARGVVARAKMRGRKNKWEAGQTPTGWRSDPHQCGHNGINWR